MSLFPLLCINVHGTSTSLGRLSGDVLACPATCCLVGRRVGLSGDALACPLGRRRVVHVCACRAMFPITKTVSSRNALNVTPRKSRTCTLLIINCNPDPVYAVTQWLAKVEGPKLILGSCFYTKL